MEPGIWLGLVLVAIAALWAALAARARRRTRRIGADDGGRAGSATGSGRVSGAARATAHWLRRLGLTGSAAAGRLGARVRHRRRPDPRPPGTDRRGG